MCREAHGQAACCLDKKCGHGLSPGGVLHFDYEAINKA